jgi:hypothetical protein
VIQSDFNIIYVILKTSTSCAGILIMLMVLKYVQHLSVIKYFHETSAMNLVHFTTQSLVITDMVETCSSTRQTCELPCGLVVR